MALKIRLRRMGGNNKPSFRIIVADARRPNEGRFIENLGWYDPKIPGVNYKLKLDRIEHWKKQGAVITDTVRSLIKKARSAAPATATPPPVTAE